ncbi:MAG: hypothetical protein AB7P40_22585 [Chloroflexota bacterium]
MTADNALRLELRCTAADGRCPACRRRSRRVYSTYACEGADLPTARVRLPAYSPDLNPSERVLEEVRCRIEGRIYDSVADKQAVAQAYLASLAADPDAVRHLCGWDWLTNALDHLPAPATA